MEIHINPLSEHISPAGQWKEKNCLKVLITIVGPSAVALGCGNAVVLRKIGGKLS